MTVDIQTFQYHLGDPISSTATDVNSFLLFNAAGSVWTDETSDTKTSTSADITFPSVSGSAWYASAGAGVNINSIIFINSTVGIGGVQIWEYSLGGGNWATLTVNIKQGAMTMTGTNLTTVVGVFDPPSDWNDDTVNGVSGRWIRGKYTTTYSTAIVGSSVGVGRVNTFSRTISVDITGGRVFGNCFARISAYNQMTGATFSGIFGRCRVAGGAWNSFSGYHNTLPSGEQYTWERAINLTSAFSTANNSGINLLVELEVSVLHSADTATTNIVQDLAAELFINFKFDETIENSCMRQLEIPFVNGLGGSALTASLQTIYTIPIINVEPGYSLISSYILIEGNSIAPGAGSYQIGFQFDADSEILSPTYNNAANSGVQHKRLITLSTYDPTNTHTIKLRSTTPTAAACTRITGKLILVYKCIKPTPGVTSMPITRQRLLGKCDILKTTSGDPTILENDIFVSALTPTLVQAVNEISFHPGASTITAGSFNIKNTGDVGFTSVGSLSRNGNGGNFIFRFACPSATIVRGKNTYRTELYSTTHPGDHIQNLLYLWYNTICPSQGWWALSIQKKYLFYSQDITPAIRITTAATPLVELHSSNNYFFDDIHFEVLNGLSSASSTYNYNIDVLTSEGDGQLLVPGGTVSLGSEIGSRQYKDGIRHGIARWKNDLRLSTDFSGHIDPLTPRTVSVIQTAASSFDLITQYVVLNQSYTLSGTLRGYSGDGSGITVILHDFQGQALVSTTTSIGGIYSFNWYDDINIYYTEAQQSSNLKGRSKNGTVGPGFDIILKPPEVTSIY